MLHIGLIPDGTRRWAKNNQKNLEYAYSVMVSSIAQCIEFFFSHDASSVSIYLLSKDNLQRSQEELRSVFKAESYLIRCLLTSIIEKYSLKVVCAGSLNLLPSNMRDAISLKSHCNSSNKTLYLCIAYDPLDELSACLSDVIPVDGQDILSKLWVPERLDIVIRTSGENRLSSFLPIQSSYAELIFLDQCINDVTNNDLSNCLDVYYKRIRRFGR
jgi:undecaprenyl diphosphate synthase